MLDLVVNAGLGEAVSLVRDAAVLLDRLPHSCGSAGCPSISRQWCRHLRRPKHQNNMRTNYSLGSQSEAGMPGGGKDLAARTNLSHGDVNLAAEVDGEVQ